MSIKFKHIVFLFFFWILIFTSKEKKDVIKHSKEKTQQNTMGKEPDTHVIDKI